MFIEADAGGSFTEDVGLTFCNELDEVRIDVMVLVVEFVAAFVDGFGVTCRTYLTKKQTNKKTIISLIHIYLINRITFPHLYKSPLRWPVRHVR